MSHPELRDDSWFYNCPQTCRGPTAPDPCIYLEGPVILVRGQPPIGADSELFYHEYSLTPSCADAFKIRRASSKSPLVSRAITRKFPALICVS